MRTQPLADGHHAKALRRILFPFYHRGEGFRHFFRMRICSAGVAWIIFWPLSFFLALGNDRQSIYQLFAMACGLGVIAFGWAIMRRANLNAQRELPRYATQGEPMRYTVRVTNRNRRMLQRAWLCEMPQDPRPDLATFEYLHEPGEERRNAFDRLFAFFRWKWLLQKNRVFIGGISKQSLHLPAAKQESIALELVPTRRGVIVLDDLRVLLPDAFGLFQRCKRVPASRSMLTVLPKRYALPPLELPGGTAFQMNGAAQTHRLGNTGEFMGLRDYRPGDSLRSIHWKSWAHTGRAIVKELEDTSYPRYGLILDTYSVRKSDAQFEEAVSVAASFAAEIDTNHSLVDLMFVKNQAHRITAGHERDHTAKLLDVLAGVTPERTEQFDKLLQLVMTHQKLLTSCVVIFIGWDQARADFMAQMKRNGLACVPLIIGDGPPPQGQRGYWLESGKIAESLSRLPQQLQSY